MWSHKSFALLSTLLMVLFFAACDDGKKSDADIDTPVTDTAADGDLLTDDIVTDDILAEGDPEPTDGDQPPAEGDPEPTEGDTVVTDEIVTDELTDSDDILTDNIIPDEDLLVETRRTDCANIPAHATGAGDNADGKFEQTKDGDDWLPATFECEWICDDDYLINIAGDGCDFQTIVYVDLNANGAVDGTSWENAYTDLSLAIEDAVSGQEIWVAAGTYYATTCPMFACNGNDRKKHFTLKLGVALYGGFTGTEVTRADRDWLMNETLLSADLNDDDVWDNGAGTWSNREENAWHVIFITNDYYLDDTTILDGFTIKNGQADVGPTDNTAGGIRLGANNAPTIRNCIFDSNYGSAGSAAISVEVSTGTVIDNCTFSGNFAAGSSAIGLRDSSVAISDSVFDDNYVTAGAFGGAISLDGTSTLTVTGSTFSLNGGEGTDPAEAVILNDGGVLSVTDCSFTENAGTPISSSDAASDTEIVNSVFAQNTATEVGAIRNGGTMTITGCDFTDNTASETSGAIQNDGTMTVTDSRFEGNTAGSFGGAIMNQGGNTSLVNCLFTGNSAAYGGAIANVMSNPSIINCTVSGNTAPNGSGIINAQSDPAIVNTIVRDVLYNMPAGEYFGMTFADSFPEISFSDIAGCGGSAETCGDGTESCWVAACGDDAGNNIDEDPLFVGSGDDPFALQATSPCVNNGSNAAVPAGVTTDLLGADRIQDTTVDMGAYEF